MTTAETTGPQAEEGLKIGDQVKAAEITGNDFSWYEYRINLTTELPPNGVVRQISYKNTERSMSEYNGTQAILFKTISKGRSWNLVSDNYYDTSMSNFLGGKIVTTRDGELPYTEEFSPSEVNREMSGFFKKERMLTYQGTEPITVPAGTYPDAKKYTIYNSDNDVMYTYWFAPDVPIPILIQFPNKYITGNNGFESRELTGWG